MWKWYFKKNAKKAKVYVETCWKFANWLLETFWPAPNGYCSPFGKLPDNIGDLLGNTYKIVEIFCENTQIIVGLGPVDGAPFFAVSPCVFICWVKFKNPREKGFSQKVTRRDAGPIAHHVLAIIRHFVQNLVVLYWLYGILGITMKT